MTERQFQTELIRGLRHDGFHVVPIPDSGGGARFGVKRCYDLGIAMHGVYYGVELKRAAGTSLSFAELKPHQRDGLRECKMSGHIPLVVCLFEHGGELAGGRKKVRKSQKTLEAWAVTYESFLVGEKTLPRKSAPLTWWRHNGFELTPIRVGAFDKDGNPAIDKRSGKRKMVWGWDFSAVHADTGMRWAV